MPYIDWLPDNKKLELREVVQELLRNFVYDEIFLEKLMTRQSEELATLLGIADRIPSNFQKPPWRNLVEIAETERSFYESLLRYMCFLEPDKKLLLRILIAESVHKVLEKSQEKQEDPHLEDDQAFSQTDEEE